MQVDTPEQAISYSHNALGNRVAKLINGQVVEQYLWQDLTTLLAVYDGQGNLKQRFEYTLGHTPTSFTQNGQRYFIQTDHLGSPRVIVDNSGNIVKTINYDSYGNITHDSNPEFQIPFGFAGGLYDQDTKLIRFGYRDYDPETGRWTARDPIGFAGGDTNLYGYVLGDPVNRIDLDGLRWETVGVDYHGTQNWMLAIANRLGNLQEGTVMNAYNCDGCTRDLIQQWIPSNGNDRNYCGWGDPMPGDIRKIEQTFQQGKDGWNVEGKSWHWHPPVPSSTYQNASDF